MLIHELNFLSPSNPTGQGWDEQYDTTSVAGYTFYGLAPEGAADSDPKWWIIASRLNADGSTAKTRYYKPNQVWSTRASALSLP